jgi:hypothetical protein
MGEEYESHKETTTGNLRLGTWLGEVYLFFILQQGRSFLISSFQIRFLARILLSVYCLTVCLSVCLLVSLSMVRSSSSFGFRVRGFLLEGVGLLWK